MRILTIMACVLMVTNVYAEDNVVLHKGDVAPFDGVFLTQDNAQKASDTKYNLGVCQRVSDLKDTENTLLTQRVTNANTAVSNLSDQLAKTQDNSFWKSVGMFVLGGAVASLVAVGASRAVR
jgi:hypothetical protein